MRQAVVVVNLDPQGVLTSAELSAAITGLREGGIRIVAGRVEELPPLHREVELIIPGNAPETVRQTAMAMCTATLSAITAGVVPSVGAVAFMSAGTREDALAVIGDFGLTGQLRELTLVDEEHAEVVLGSDSGESPSVGKLHTALEAALNREVQLSLE